MISRKTSYGGTFLTVLARKAGQIHAFLRNALTILRWMFENEEFPLQAVDFNTLDTSLNNNGKTMLHQAASDGNVEIVKLLLDNAHRINLDVNKQTTNGETALQLASIERQVFPDLSVYFKEVLKFNNLEGKRLIEEWLTENT